MHTRLPGVVLLQSALAEQPPLLISQALIAVEVRDDKEKRRVGRGEKTIDALFLSLRNGITSEQQTLGQMWIIQKDAKHEISSLVKSTKH